MDVTKVMKEHDLELEDPTYVKFLDPKTLFVFHAEFFNLNIYELAAG